MSAAVAQPGCLLPLAGAPRLTDARCELLREIQILDEYGERRSIHIPCERPLTVFVDKRELVTLMTLGARPELLVLGYLHNQRLVSCVQDVESITVDWDVGAAAVRTHRGLQDLAAKTAHRVVTTGCGQGTGFGDAMTQLHTVTLPGVADARIRQGTLHRMLETMRQQDSIHRKAGSVHGCALFRGAELLMFVEDVGRHRILRGEVAGSTFNIIAPEGTTVAADEVFVTFDPTKISVYANDWRVTGGAA